MASMRIAKIAGTRSRGAPRIDKKPAKIAGFLYESDDAPRVAQTAIGAVSGS